MSARYPSHSARRSARWRSRAAPTPAEQLAIDRLAQAQAIYWELDEYDRVSVVARVGPVADGWLG